MLVPIRVGMILNINPYAVITVSCPHTRGDDPGEMLIVPDVTILSPYAWG